MKAPHALKGGRRGGCDRVTVPHTLKGGDTQGRGACDRVTVPHDLNEHMFRLQERCSKSDNKELARKRLNLELCLLINSFKLK